MLGRHGVLPPRNPRGREFSEKGNNVPTSPVSHGAPRDFRCQDNRYSTENSMAKHLHLVTDCGRLQGRKFHRNDGKSNALLFD